MATVCSMWLAKSAPPSAWAVVRSNQLPGRHLEVAEWVNIAVSRVLELDFLALHSPRRLGRFAPTPAGPSSRRLLICASGWFCSNTALGGVGVTDRLGPASEIALFSVAVWADTASLWGCKVSLTEITPHLGHRDRRHDAAFTTSSASSWAVQ